MQTLKIIVGLGNPGKKYKNTRHNVGFMVLDKMAENLDLTWKTDKKFNAETAIFSSDEKKIILMKPLSFMNNSGQAVHSLMSYYGVIPKFSFRSLFKKNIQKISDLTEILTIIHDDLDIELGKYKISTDSRAAGHNGVQSIIDHLKTKNFKRIRVGIKTEIKEKIPGNKFVLQNFNKEEMKTIEKIIPQIISQL